MKLSTVIMVGVGVVALSTVGLLAEDAVKAPAAKEGGAAMAEQEFTLTGVLTKVEHAKEISWVLTVNGEVTARLAPKAAEGAAINLDTFAKAKVTLVGTGHEMQHHGKKTVFISQVTKLEKAAEEKPAAAPEAKPAAKPAE